MHKIFCVIVTFNGIKWVDKCFGSLKASNYPVKVIAIDNGSTDGTQEAIKTNFHEVDFIQSKENLGFGKANNIGIKRAFEDGADFVFLLNQDAWVEPNTLPNLIEVAQNNGNYGILSPLHLNGQGTALDYNFSLYVIPQLCPEFYSDACLNSLKEMYPTKFINAAAWLLPRVTVQKVGYFDELFFIYGEDRNYTDRLHFYKMKLGIVPSAIVYHDRLERKGKKNAKGILIETEVKLLVIMLDINSSGILRNYIKSLRKLKSLYSRKDVSLIAAVTSFLKLIALHSKIVKSRKSYL